MRTCRAKHSSDSKGVAIVVVLGLIAVLMMMAVAFSIHMRIERTGASNYRYGVQARHMVWGGLANAIQDLDGLMSQGGQPVMFPDWRVAASTGGTGNAGVLSSAAAEYMPASAVEEARLAGATWKYIRDDKGIERGRYSFVIFNSSGLLDANMVGGDPRGAGTNSYEIQLDNVPGLSSVSEFLNKASTDGRYETFPELVNVNQRVGDGSSFSVFSLTPVKDTYNIGGPIDKRAYIGADVGKWNQNEIIAAFSDAGVPNPGLAYTNLLDYTDSDSAPRSLAAGCVERTPMINEIGLLCQLSFAGGNLTGQLVLFNEWAYPFVIESKDSFTMHYDIEVIEGGNNTIAGCIPSGAAGSHSRANFTAGSAVPMSFGSVDHAPVAFSGNTTEAVVNVDFKIRVAAYIEGPDGRVDEVPSPYNIANGVELTVNRSITSGGSQMVTNSWQCMDPRFNWNPKSGLQWYQSSSLEPITGYEFTYRAENFVTKLFFDPPAYGAPDSMDLDDDMAMRVANRPLQSLGELGYLCYDWWRTIRLYEHQGLPNPYPEAKKYHKVLDHFTIWTNDYRRGLVNINTTNLDVLASAFYRMPEEEYSTNRLVTWADAKAMAQAIIDSGPYTNLSEMGKSSIDWSSLTTGPTEICKESAIRNTCGILTARDNLFTVIIRADSFSTGLGGDAGKGMALATSRAAAEVWRDPVPDENGNHKILIRSFRYLED